MLPPHKDVRSFSSFLDQIPERWAAKTETANPHGNWNAPGLAVLFAGGLI